ncbi:hypothetical protein CONPUDRAFT_157284 [Coniophora puteana RWD-64-598 SS2]|uniref:DUF6533 domain-containing protein n=1 Tax=Coniophora puteana (strain RWD-64-598) TaxID=741705 RepID=A0A5M3MEK5_CONPW|nr:uncharacterized protein CONPUDRAFT_157284 [Coniophora puteana RWD-64-598 SS2]EIW77011.1 hypothetical protein CONPUDRAFT_157284 [Coniophora puteana RWD-64-598 SS2]
MHIANHAGLSYEEEVSLRTVTRLNTYAILASGTVLTYDTLTSLDLEVKYIWQAKWSIMKALYLWTRYIAFITPVLALVYLPSIFWIDGVGIAGSEIVLAVRTWALWGRNRKVAAVVATVYVGIVVGAMTTLYELFQDTRFIVVPGHPGCFMIGNGVMAKVCWGMVLIGEAVWVLLLLVESYFVYKAVRSLPTLFRIMFTDGVLYFVLLFVGIDYLFAVLVIAMIAPGQSSSILDITIILSVPGRVVCTVLVAHLILHVKRVADPELRLGANQTTLGLTNP